VRHSRGETYIGHGRLCVCLTLAVFPDVTELDPDVTWGMVGGAVCTIGRICRYYDSIHVCKLIALYTVNAYSANAKCQRVLVLALWLVINCEIDKLTLESHVQGSAGVTINFNFWKSGGAPFLKL